MGEFELIRRFFRRPPTGAVILGVGDDCALLRPPDPGQVLAISSDMLVEGRHFFTGTDPASVGHKSLAVNLSDLAAMGAQPLGFTLALALPAIDERWLEAFCRGMFALADRHACPLVGGDTTRGPLAISITVFGQVPPEEALRRDRAQAGDEVWVSAPPNEALAHALHGGDDYELLFTAPAQAHSRISRLCPEGGMIGKVRMGRGILLTGRDGTSAALEGTGFDHFSG